MAMDVTQVKSLLDQATQAFHGPASGRAGGSTGKDATRAFTDLLSDSSRRSEGAQKAFEDYAIEGQGELHDVMAQIAKADVTFRFLLEVRNKLTEAYQEISRLQV
jgi:flagellar hook-basal body complex protein FliE